MREKSCNVFSDLHKSRNQRDRFEIFLMCDMGSFRKSHIRRIESVMSQNVRIRMQFRTSPPMCEKGIRGIRAKTYKIARLNVRFPNRPNYRHATN